MKTTEADEQVRPFASGYDYGCWRVQNCHGCAKYNPDVYDGGCEIDLALGIAYVGSGEVAVQIWQRMGEGGACLEKAEREVEKADV